MRKKRLIIILIISGIIGFLLLQKLVFLYTDFLWFKTIGYKNVFFKILQSKFIIFLLLTSLSFSILFSISKITDLTIPRQIRVISFATVELIDKKNYKPYLRKILFFVILIISLLMGFSSLEKWHEWILFLNASEFGIKDPLFKKDIGFYVFKLPFIEYILGKLLLILFLSLILSVITYSLYRQIVITSRSFSFAKYAKLVSYTIIGIILLLASLSCRLAAYNLLYSTRGAIFGASYTDVHAVLPALNVLTYVLIGVGIVYFVNAFTKGFLQALYSSGLIVIVWLIGLGIYPLIIQRLVVEPNELIKEMPYIKSNIKYTQYAYGLDKIKIVNFSPKEELSAKDLEEAHVTLRNIRLWDYSPLLKTYSQLQEMRTYYKFFDSDCDRYKIRIPETDEYCQKQVIVAVRELSYPDIPRKLWMNTHLIYTHGNGLVVSGVNEVSKEGLPEYYIKDIPPVSLIKEIKITQPRIYYGELTDTYCITNTKIKELDYPKEQKNEYCVYQGRGGVKINNLLKRILFALRFNDYKIFFSNNITKESRMMYYRNINDRLKKVFPLIAYDSDPYIVISNDGKLFWLCDGYTLSNKYPYSEPFMTNKIGYNYIRNSVKVVIDAYNGSLDFYIFDEKDPILKTYKKCFPELLKPKEEMSPDLLEHIKYPKDIFLIQASMYTKYHMQDAKVFYNKEDLWKLPTILNKPYYMIMKLPRVTTEPTGEYVLMLPFTPAKKNNLTAWLVARCDFKNYGEFIVYVFPKQRLIYGPKQIEARIDQHPEISKQLTLWNQGGSKVIRGNLLVIPIKDSLIYVQPLYLSAEKEGSLPELKRVIVAFHDKVVMEKTLTAALAELFRYKPFESVSLLKEKIKTEKKEEIKEKLKQYLKDLSEDLLEFSNLLESLKTTINKLKEYLE